MKKFIRALAIAFMVLSGVAHAQDYPTKDIKIIVPFGPGGASDVVARIVAQHLGPLLGTQVIVDNRPGASGNIGMLAAAKSAPDGYTLFLGNVSTNAINATTYAGNLQMDPAKDLAAISMVATLPHLLVSSAKFPPKTVQAVVAYGKSHPGELNYASPGAGSYSMIDTLAFEKAAGLKMLHVPYKGGAGQFVTSLIANDVQIAFINASSALEMVRAGRLNALAVTTPQRIPELPNVQTMAEAGFPGIGTSAWQGIFVPAGTPQPVIQKLHSALVTILNKKDLQASFAKSLIIATPSASPAQFATLVKNESAHWSKLVKDLDVKADQ